MASSCSAVTIPKPLTKWFVKGRSLPRSKPSLQPRTRLDCNSLLIDVFRNKASYRSAFKEGGFDPYRAQASAVSSTDELAGNVKGVGCNALIVANRPPWV